MMKKIVVLFIIVQLPLFCYSQKLRLGVCLNPHVDWFAENSSKLSPAGGKVGIEGGLLLENYFAKNYALNSGIRLGIYGAKLQYNDSVYLKTDESEQLISPSTKVTYKLQYITVPIGLKLKTNQIGYMTYYAVLGFTPQINIGAKAYARNILDNAGVSKEIGLFNLGYHFGGGIEYGIGGNTSLIGGIVYNNGFVDILSRQEAKQSLNMLTIMIGIMF